MLKNLFIMKKCFTDKEDETLAEMLEVVKWSLSNQPKKDPLGREEYDLLFQEESDFSVDDEYHNLSSFTNRKISVADMEDNYSISREFDYAHPVWDYNEHYEEEIFWDELKERIVARAAVLSLTEDDYLNLSEDEKLIFQEKKKNIFGTGIYDDLKGYMTD